MFEIFRSVCFDFRLLKRVIFINLLILSFINLGKSNKYVLENEPSGKFTHLNEDDFLRSRILKTKTKAQTQPILLDSALSSVDSVRSAYFAWKRQKIEDEAMFNPDRFEGDIMRINGKKQEVQDRKADSNNDTNSQGKLRNAIRPKDQLWQTTKIPYQLSTRYSSYSRSRIAAAMDEYAEKTCIQFVPRKKERDYVSILPDDGCYSDVGRSFGKQIISLDEGCLYEIGTIIHELMHTLGFFHEQSRTDRDKYVEILFENILNGYEDQFQKYSSSVINNQSIAYDYGSVMHYPAKAFAKGSRRSKLTTIKPKQSGVKIGQRKGFSDVDVQEINALYCDGKPVPNSSPAPAPAPGAPAPSPTPTKAPTNCGTDLRKDCASLTSSNYCVLFKSWMEIYCPVSCQFCDSGSTSCSNRLETYGENYCPTLARLGYCNNPITINYMAFNCQKSCGKC